MIRNILASLLLAGLCGAALADDPVPAPAPETATANTPPDPDSKLCLRETGSHLRPKQGECLPVTGSRYSREDVENTGSVDLSDALRRLDPSLTR